MAFAIWALIIGALLITMALSGTSLQRLPLSTAMLYLAAGYGLGPAGWDLMTPDPLAWSAILERVAEVAVLISDKWQGRGVYPWRTGAGACRCDSPSFR